MSSVELVKRSAHRILLALSPLQGRLTVALGAVWLLLALEFSVVALLHRDRFTGVWELQNGLLGLLPLTLLVGAALGLLGAPLSSLLENATRARPRLWLSLSAGVFAFAVAYGVGGGRLLQTLAARLGFAGLTAITGFVMAYVASPFLARGLSRYPGRTSLLLLVLMLAAQLVNQLVLVRLYPAFHLGLALLVALAAPSALGAVWKAEGRGTKKKRMGLALVGVLAVSASTLKPATRWFGGFDNFRWLLVEQAPLLGQIVRISAWLSPAQVGQAQECGDPQACQQHTQAVAPSGMLSLQDRDILLISIDALRADHVGAYGYKRNTTPNIDQLAQQGIVFERAYVSAPHTSYSVTSMMTGKYMRPLLAQGAGQDSDTWAGLLRRYEYRTAAFYPPAVFFIDEQRFASFKQTGLGFEYKKVEFAEGARRLAQVRDYVEQQPQGRNLFIWVHLFGPHEPYEAQPGYDFGDRDIDRYDSEIAAADRSVGHLVSLMRHRRENPVIVVTADHGEEFGDHGGRYHGSSVYEEQVHVPLIIAAEGALKKARIPEPVQTIDLLPTFLDALSIPIPPRIRGKSLVRLMRGEPPATKRFVLAETEDQTLLGQGTFRLLCARRIGACRLFDLATDPKQKRDISKREPKKFARLRRRQQEFSASHGRFEEHGLRATGKGWPAAILRGISGDGEAAPEIATLLDDADVQIRRKAAELLFELGRPETAAALRLALGREDDQVVRSFSALALTRLGQGAPLSYELIQSPDTKWRRLSALALAEAGDARGEAELIHWLMDERPTFERTRQILGALAEVRSKDAIWPMIQLLKNVRLRPYAAKALAEIGDDAALGSIVNALAEERYQSARGVLAKAALDLGAGAELAKPLIRFLGVPDPIQGGLGIAAKAGILAHVGGPDKKGLEQLREHSSLGAAMIVFVPKGGNGQGVRVLVRGRVAGPKPLPVRVGLRKHLVRYNRKGEALKVRDLPRIDDAHSVDLELPGGGAPHEVHKRLPERVGISPGKGVEVVVFADHQIELEAIAFVPLADELPPPAPEPWQGNGQGKVSSNDDATRSPAQ